MVATRVDIRRVETPFLAPLTARMGRGRRRGGGGFFQKIMTSARGVFSAVGGVFGLCCRFCAVGRFGFVKLFPLQGAAARAVFAASCPPGTPVGALRRLLAAPPRGSEGAKKRIFVRFGAENVANRGRFFEKSWPWLCRDRPCCRRSWPCLRRSVPCLCAGAARVGAREPPSLRGWRGAAHAARRSFPSPAARLCKSGSGACGVHAKRPGNVVLPGPSVWVRALWRASAAAAAMVAAVLAVVAAVAGAAVVALVVAATVARTAFFVVRAVFPVARAAVGAAIVAAAVATVALAVLTRTFLLGPAVVVGFGRGPGPHAEAEDGGHGKCQQFLHVSRCLGG